MQYALDFLHDLFPLNFGSYHELSQEHISHTDQLIYRFSQLQDTIGGQLFPLILQGLGEYNPQMPLIDIIHRLEKLSIIEDADKWLFMREIRNLVTHEYPGNEKEIVDGLNEIYRQSQYLSSTLEKILVFIKQRNWT
jgi:hypothetical protein